MVKLRNQIFIQQKNISYLVEEIGYLESILLKNLNHTQITSFKKHIQYKLQYKKDGKRRRVINKVNILVAKNIHNIYDTETAIFFNHVSRNR